MKHFLVVCVFSLLKKSSFFVPSALIAHATNLHHQCCSPKYREASQFTINTILPFGWLLVFFVVLVRLYLLLQFNLTLIPSFCINWSFSCVFPHICKNLFFSITAKTKWIFGWCWNNFFFERKKNSIIKNQTASFFGWFLVRLPVSFLYSLFTLSARFKLNCYLINFVFYLKWFYFHLVFKFKISSSFDEKKNHDYL